MKIVWAILLLAASGQAQTYSPGTGNYLASAAGMGSYPANYFSNIAYDNLLATKASFQGEQHIYTVYVAGPSTFQAATTSGSVTITPQNGLVGTGVYVGAPVSGTGIPTGATVASVGTTTFTLAAGYAATATTAPGTYVAVTSQPNNSTTTFQDFNPYNQISANLSSGWAIQRNCRPYGGSGVQAGCSNTYAGTIASNTATNGAIAGEVYTVPAAAMPFQPNDLVTIVPPLSGLNPTNVGWTANGGTCVFAQDTTTANLPAPAVTGLPQVYGAFQLRSTGSCNIFAGVDTGGGPNVLMNGTTTFQVVLELISGSCTVQSSVVRGIGGSATVFLTGAATPVLSGTNPYTWYGSGSETAAGTTAANINASIQLNGTCVADIVPLSATVPPVTLTGSAGAAAPGGALTPYAHTNPTVFSDTYVNLWKNANYGFCRMNYVYGDPLAGDTLENLLQPYGHRQQTNTSEYHFGQNPGIPVGIEEWLEFSAAAGCTKMEYALPPSLQAIDYTHLMAFLGAPCSDSYGQIRCNLGHPASWLTSGMKLVFSWNETWNTGDTGAWLGGGVGAMAYASIAGQAIHQSPYYNSNVMFLLPLTPGPAVTAYVAGYNPLGYIDGTDINGYAQAGTTTATQPAMFQAMLAEAEATGDTNLNQPEMGVQSGFVSQYETSEGSQNGACTVSGCAGLYGGLGAGLMEALRVAALQRAYPGHFQYWGQWSVTNQNQPYSSTASSSPATGSDLWIGVANLRGAGGLANGKYLATALYNAAAKMGNGINVSAAGVPTFNFTAQNGIPNESNIPLPDFFAYCNGSGSGCTDSNRSFLLFNNDSVPHTFTLAGAFTLSGTVTKTTYASTNATPGLNDNNETLNATPVLQNTVATGSAASSYTVGPYSMVLVQGSTAVGRVFF